MLRRTLARLAVAATAPVLAATLVAPAHANGHELLGLDSSLVTLGLTTDAYLSGSVLTVEATGTFSGGWIANNSTALQIAGTETYADDDGLLHVVPLAGAPFAVRFVNSNTVQWQWYLASSHSTVHVEWTAEAAGLAPTPFVGTCYGTYSLLGGTEAEIKTC